jgi:large repetitive protein
VLGKPLAVVLILFLPACAAEVGSQDLALTSDGGAGGLDGGAPIAVDDAVETMAGQPLSFSVLANDSDPQGDPLAVSLTGAADWPLSRSTYDCGADGTCWVDAYPHESGTGWFAYRACDPGGRCAEAIVTVTIHYLVTQPYATDDEATTGADQPVEVDVLANDDGNGDWFDTWSLAVIAGPFYGAAEVDPGAGTIIYTGGPGYRGSDLFEYFVCNMHGRCTTAWVYVFVDPATAPVVARADGLFIAYQGVGRTLDIAANDTPPGAGVPSLLVAPAHGTAVPDGGSLWYTGDWEHTGADVMIYSVCVGQDCAASSVRVHLRGNSEPTPVDDNLETDEDHPISFNPMANDTDPDGDPLRFGGCWERDWPWRDATFQCDQSTGWCDFTPAPTQTGPGSLECSVCDELTCVSSFVNINVTRVVNPPECYADSATTAEDTPVDIPVLGNDAFNGGRAQPETMTFEGPSHGTAVVDGWTGVVTYTPDPDYPGPTDSFSYSVCDVFELCCGASVTVTVTPVADPPAFTADASNSVQRISRSGVPVPLRAVDPDGDPVSFARVSGALPDNLTLGASGSFTSTGNHKKGTYQSTIRATDLSGAEATSLLTIIVE